jgi:hypothetical protein
LRRRQLSSVAKQPCSSSAFQSHPLHQRTIDIPAAGFLPLRHLELVGLFPVSSVDVLSSVAQCRLRTVRTEAAGENQVAHDTDRQERGRTRAPSSPCPLPPSHCCGDPRGVRRVLLAIVSVATSASQRVFGFVRRICSSSRTGSKSKWEQQRRRADWSARWEGDGRVEQRRCRQPGGARSPFKDRPLDSTNEQPCGLLLNTPVAQVACASEHRSSYFSTRLRHCSRRIGCIRLSSLSMGAKQARPLIDVHAAQNRRQTSKHNQHDACRSPCRCHTVCIPRG